MNEIINKSYTTDQLAKYFGVSKSTLDKWIKEGRFIGLETTNTENIKANTLWMAKTGKIYFVHQIIRDWEKEKKSYGNQFNISQQIALYEAKYGGKFHSRLKGNLTPEEETDFAAWSYFIKEFNNQKIKDS